MYIKSPDLKNTILIGMVLKIIFVFPHSVELGFPWISSRVCRIDVMFLCFPIYYETYSCNCKSDSLFCNKIVANQFIFTRILYKDISAHFAIFYIDRATVNKILPTYFKKWICSQENLELFFDLLQNNDWSDVSSSNNPQDAFLVFSDCYRVAYKCSPPRSMKYGYKTRKQYGCLEDLKNSYKLKISYTCTNGAQQSPFYRGSG